MPNALVRKMEQISFNEFKRKTHHHKVKYEWISIDGKKIKEFETDKFYCNYYKGILSMPKFSLSMGNNFFKIDENVFKCSGEYGETTFIIQGLK